jgi:hypothetical protein
MARTGKKKTLIIKFERGEKITFIIKFERTKTYNDLLILELV